MPVYAYRGVTAAGKATRGHLDAESSRSARAKLRRDGVFLTDFQETSAEALTRSATGPRFNFQVSLPSLQRISGMDLAMMTRQAATLIGAGIPLVDGLRALTEQTENPRLGDRYREREQLTRVKQPGRGHSGCADVFEELC